MTTTGTSVAVPGVSMYDKKIREARGEKYREDKHLAADSIWSEEYN